MRAHRNLHLWTAEIAVALFALLAFAVADTRTATFDQAVRDAIHSIANPTLTAVATAVSTFGSVAMVVALTITAIAALYFAGRKPQARALAVTVAGAMTANTLLKLLFQLPRPEAFFGEAPTSYTFPSGHAAFAGALYLTLALLAAEEARTPATRAAIFVALGVLVFVIGLSRIYLGVHNASDVLGGYLVAIAVIALTHLALRRYFTRSGRR